MEYPQNSVWYVVLGAFLALATSLVLEYLKQYNKEKSLRNNYKTVLKLELKHLISIIDKLIEDYGSKTFFSFGILDQLDRNLQRLESSRKDTIYLKEESKKEEILTYINDVLVIASDIRGNENYGFKEVIGELSEDKNRRLEYCSRHRQMYSLRTVDMKRRGQDIIDYLDKN